MPEMTLEKLAKTLDDVVARLDQLTQIPPNHIQTTSLGLITHNAGLISSGEFRSGNNKEPGMGFTGVRLGFPGFIYGGEEWQFAGVETDILQIGIKVSDGKLYAGVGNVVLDETGIFVANGGALGTVYISFADASGVPNMYILTDSSNNFGLGSDAIGGSILFVQKMTAGQYGYVSLFEPSTDVTGFVLFPEAGGNGGLLQVRGDSDDGISLHTSDTDKHIRIIESTTTPPDPTAGAEMNVYMSGNNFVIQFNNGGTVRYKYLDLTGTTVTWVHSTTPP